MIYMYEYFILIKLLIDDCSDIVYYKLIIHDDSSECIIIFTKNNKHCIIIE